MNSMRRRISVEFCFISGPIKVENLLEELDAEEEWYFDPQAHLLYLYDPHTFSSHFGLFWAFQVILDIEKVIWAFDFFFLGGGGACPPAVRPHKYISTTLKSVGPKPTTREISMCCWILFLPRRHFHLHVTCGSDMDQVHQSILAFSSLLCPPTRLSSPSASPT